MSRGATEGGFGWGGGRLSLRPLGAGRGAEVTNAPRHPRFALGWEEKSQRGAVLRWPVPRFSLGGNFEAGTGGVLLLFPPLPLPMIRPDAKSADPPGSEDDVLQL